MLGVRVLEEKNMIHTISTERLVHVLRSIALKQQTGRLSIEQFGELESEKGEIFFVHGETVFTRTGQEVGDAALSRMMNWRVAQYIFFEEVQTPAVISHRNRVVQGPRQTSSLSAVELEQTRYISPIGTPALTLLLIGNSSRSEEHTSELQSPCNLVCRLLLEKKKKKKYEK